MDAQALLEDRVVRTLCQLSSYAWYSSRLQENKASLIDTVRAAVRLGKQHLAAPFQ